MAKYYGNIGFVRTLETTPGVWTEHATERFYRGEVVKDNRRWSATDSVNGKLFMRTSISIIADDFAINNCAFLRYVNYAGFNWEISDVEMDYPRLKLFLGSVYKGVTANG